MPHPRKHQWYRVHRALDWLIGLDGRRIVAGPMNAVALIAAWCCGVSLVLLKFCDPSVQQVDGWLRQAMSTIHINSFAIAVLLILVNLAASAIAWLARRWSPFDKRKLKRVLDSVVSNHFENQDRENHQYRATLFKVRGCWITGMWLGIAARSGDLYTQRSAVFCISAMTIKNNTGIAGECWRRAGQTIFLDALPDIRRDGEFSDGDVKVYKEAGYLDQREFDAMNVRARVFLATGIRVAGKLWGVLVLDTTDARQLPAAKQQKKHRGLLEFAATSLEQLLS